MVVLLALSGSVASATPELSRAFADWSADLAAPESMFGASTSAGDVNGDGWVDVVVGAPQYTNGGVLDDYEGGAFLYLGGSAGLATAASWSVEGNQRAARLGSSVAVVGDVDGDGFDDLVVGTETWDGAGNDVGRVQLYAGSVTGPSLIPDWTVEGPVNGSYFGSSVAGAGDVNDDGYDDVIVGAKYGTDGESAEGFAHLFLGSAVGLSAAPTWSAESDRYNAWFGSVVAGVGDVNGDGYDDVVVGAPNESSSTVVPRMEGAAYLFLGTPTGLQATPAWTTNAYGNAILVEYGSSVAAAGDLDGDRYDDVIVGAPGWRDGADTPGAAFVFLGSALGLSTTPDWQVRGQGTGERFGASVSGAGDVNGDGYDDVVVGAPARGGLAGAVYLYLGGPAGPWQAPVALGVGDGGIGLGSALAPAGDVNGDGLDDVLVSANDYAVGGSVWMYEGATLPDRDADGVYDPQDVCVDVADPAQLDDDGDGVGNACDRPALAIDGVVAAGATVDLVATGAGPGETVSFWLAPGGGGAGPCPPTLGGTCLDTGPSTVSRGSVVADGSGVAVRPSFVVAALPPGSVWSVQASIARGPGGADSVTSPLLRVDGSIMDNDADGLVDADEVALGSDPRRPDTDGDGLVDGADIGPFLHPTNPDTDGDGVLDGADVCLAGDDADDLDNDGIADRCDSCPVDPNPAQTDGDGDGLGNACEGLVLLGSPWVGDEDQALSQYASSLSSAGDVDGDGYEDLVVGAPAWRTGLLGISGEVFVYFGSPSGLDPVATWQAPVGQRGSSLGYAVSGAGDVDGDGYDEVLVAAPFHTAGQENEGRVWLYAGSSMGLPGAATWQVESDEVQGSYGLRVAGVGDVDGDGYDDVVVGSRHGTSSAGAIALFLGSPGGLSAAADQVLEGDRPGAAIGAHLAAAGDVDGDGHADVVTLSSGRVTLYLGTAGGLDPTPVRVGGLVAGVVAAAGDVNDDGYDDLIVGRPYEGVGGVASVFLGGPLGPDPTPAWTYASSQFDATFGAEVAAAGDVNGDGYDDVAVGATGYDDGQFEEGGVFVFLGSARGLAAEPAWVGESDQNGPQDPEFGFYRTTGYGGALGHLDSDGDGLSDLAVGAWSLSWPQPSEGAAFVHRGHAP